MSEKTQIVPGSLGAIAQQSGMSLAESFLNADIVILIDTSGSMHNADMRDGENLSRYAVACDELKKIQASLPGKIALLSFSSDVQFCPSGIPFDFGGMTELAKALRFAKMADVDGMRFIVISDGEPDSEADALSIAKTYKNKIDTIYIGPANGGGKKFLERLAQVSGGQDITINTKELASSVKLLLTA